MTTIAALQLTAEVHFSGQQQKKRRGILIQPNGKTQNITLVVNKKGDLLSRLS
jgi:hypothetical protein